MDPRERQNPYEESLSVAIQGDRATLWTSLPGIVQSFDPVAQTAVVQPTIMGRRAMKDGTTADITMPLLTDCPVVFPSGGGFVLTFPVAAGDECLVTFASRCIDAWWQSGGVQKQAEVRLHDLSDGFVTVGPRSKPNAVANISTSSVQLRSGDGATYLDISGTTVTLKAANVLVDGDFKVTGETVLADRLTVKANADFENAVTVDGAVSTPVIVTGSIEMGGKYGVGKLTTDYLTVHQQTDLTGPVSIAGDVAQVGGYGIAGDLTITGVIHATGDILSGKVSLYNHVHDYTQPAGKGNLSGAPLVP